MNESNLSKRLTAVAEQIPNGSRLADIGSDHAYLPCYALKRGMISSAIAGEVNEGPYQSAIEQVSKLGFQEKISVRKGNGLDVISSGEVDCITIAGMGGPLITSILDTGKEKLIGVKRLVLQPNVAANQVRAWLQANEWILISEDILEEDNVIYEVIIAEREGKDPYSEENQPLEILLGPYLMHERSVAFVKKWTSEVENWKKILRKFEKANQTSEIERKKNELTQQINKVEEILK